jgi:hypothetical protein
MDHSATLPAPARRLRPIVLVVGLAIVRGTVAAFVVWSLLVASEADGVVPDGVTVSVFDEERPAVGRLDPDLLDALRRAATDAEADGVELRVNSGWRSPAYQQLLFLEAVVVHGSQEEAERWVSTAETSAHVSGQAVDVGPSDAAAWLSEHGAAYDLCQIYRNEPWHYELRRGAVDDGCPPMYADPTEDPRMPS